MKKLEKVQNVDEMLKLQKIMIFHENVKFSLTFSNI